LITEEMCTWVEPWYAVSRWLLIAEARLHWKASPCGIL
jgi:hypothetical protein